MTNKLIKFLLFIFFIITLIFLYLSIFGISTQIFNKKIKNEILNINKKINLELKSVRILINPFNFSANIKTINPEIAFNNKKIKLNYINTNVSFKSLINQKIKIDDLQISTKKNKIKDIVSLTRLFKDNAELFLLEKIIKRGFLTGEINLNLDEEGKVKKDYSIKGFINNGSLSLLRKNSIKNLNLDFKIENKNYLLKDIRAELDQLKISSPLIKIKEKGNLLLIEGKINNVEKKINLKLLNNLLAEVTKNFDIENLELSSENDFSFSVDKKYKINDFILKSKINLNNVDYKVQLPFLKKFLPNFNNLIKLQNHKILINYKKNELNVEGKGNISIKGAEDYFDYKLSQDNKGYKFDTSFNIEKNQFLIDVLNYKKNADLKASLKLKGIYNKEEQVKFSTILFTDEEKNKLLINGLSLNKKFKISDIISLKFDFINNNRISNKIELKKEKKFYKINSKSFDATNIIEDILDSNDESNSIFSKNFNSNIDIKISKAYLDNITFVNDLYGIINIKDNKINKINLNSIFPNKKKLTLTLNINENNEKITSLFTDYPKPLIKQYKFIKGFEEGVLDFYSIKKDGISNSRLIIDNFKVKEVPIFAKLLTLASLQGIADLLTGEGIRFTDFEMKFSNKKSLMIIEEMYAIGPAVSIMMEGYIEKKKLTSLKGTLVPATTINRTISSIPLIGNILVGKKIGEGVFGVSFKIKGPPKNLKTTVNPVKTLTPRFITRTLEKIKKN